MRTPADSHHAASQIRRPHGGAEAPPRIVLRFGLYTGIALALAAILIMLLVRHFTIDQAERGATDRARYVSQFVLGSELKPRDFESPPSEKRTAKLDALFDRLVLVDGTLVADLIGRDGLVTYSTRHARIGKRIENPKDVTEVLAGISVGRVTSMTVSVDGVSSEREVHASLLPFGFADETQAGVFGIYQDYAPIAGAAQGSFLPIAGVFEIVVVALTLGLVPALRRLTRRIQAQMEEIERRAYVDPLTELPNRVLLEDRLDQALATARGENNRVGLLLMDVDRFKDVNDTLGHEAGDELLRVVGRRLRDGLRETNSLARLGGDEFAVLLPDCANATLADLAKRIEMMLREPVTLAGLPIGVSVSIGAALAPEHGDNTSLLLQHAEVAMYQAKQARVSFVMYDPATNTTDADRLALVAELRQAIDRNQFVLEYQPKANMQTGTIHGVEALVRWEHPRHGRLGPDEFIPLAEHTGLITSLSRLILAGVIEQSRAWRRAGFELTVAVNLAMADLVDPELPADLGRMLQEADLPADRVEVEITESMVMEDPFSVKATLKALNELGVRLAIDDFGTGHSSLGYLRSLPVDELKIDKSFVIGMEKEESQATIVRSTVELARNLGLKVVAEGVESDAAWRMLAGYGCHYAQGYGIAKPMSAESMNELLARSGERIDQTPLQEQTALSA